ncbi:MAG: hypothetical protein HYR60_17215 [Acidobacteria bacterium]|nr:hypothetical protein [Acidobacteriota bacterium]MBI3473979.1 hypothetical protein [Candidatus Solibacter usitatus]
MLLLLLMATAADLNQLSFMTGCWEGKRGAVSLEEHWTRPAAGTMLGMSREVKDGRTIFSEFMRIEEKDGVITYMARIGDAKVSATPFRLIRLSDSEAVFENPAHDFPQRILYRKPPGGGLHARIEGTDKGQPRGVDFPFQRGQCDATSAK